MKREWLSDATVVSMAKKEYPFAVHFLQRFIFCKVLVSLAFS